jgi:hypothetical protein
MAKKKIRKKSYLSKLLTNKLVSKESTLGWLQHKIEEIIDTHCQFVNVISEAFYTKMLINSGVEAGYN